MRLGACSEAFDVALVASADIDAAKFPGERVRR